jgi:ABC-2 type transport system ATP-binding protein
MHSSNQISIIPDSPSRPVDRSVNAISTNGLSKSYGDHVAVRDLSFDLPTGTVVGLIGPNGSGKTTTMKMLLGLIAPTAGDLELLGTRVGSPGWGAVLRRVGAIVEEPPLYNRMTARANLRYQALALGQSIDDGRLDEILELIGLAGRADDQPRRFSLGMRQRLGIGLTLVGSPDLIILDEPANGLDPAGIMEVRRLLGRLRDDGATVLVSSHQLAEIEQICDSVVILQNGELAASGSTASVLAERSTNTFTVTFRQQDQQRGLSVLQSVFGSFQVDASTVTIEPDDDTSGHDVSRLLAQHQVFPEALSKSTMSLEDVFLDLTGSPNPRNEPTTRTPLDEDNQS